MAPLRVSTTKSEWLPDDPTAFVPTRLWKLPFITTWDDSRNQNRPTDSAEEAFTNFLSSKRPVIFVRFLRRIGRELLERIPSTGKASRLPTRPGLPAGGCMRR